MIRTMLGMRRRDQGFEWHKYVRTTIQLRRNARRELAERMKNQAADGVKAAGAAAAGGVRAASSAAADGARVAGSAAGYVAREGARNLGAGSRLAAAGLGQVSRLGVRFADVGLGLVGERALTLLRP